MASLRGDDGWEWPEELREYDNEMGVPGGLALARAEAARNHARMAQRDPGGAGSAAAVWSTGRPGEGGAGVEGDRRSATIPADRPR